MYANKAIRATSHQLHKFCPNFHCHSPVIRQRKNYQIKNYQLRAERPLSLFFARIKNVNAFMWKPSSTFDFSDAPTKLHQSAAWSFRLLAGARWGDLTSVQISWIIETSAAVSSVETGIGEAGASICPIARIFKERKFSDYKDRRGSMMKEKKFTTTPDLR